MSVRTSKNIEIPYGVSLPPGSHLLVDANVARERSAPIVMIDPGARKVLRLNGDQYAFHEPPDLRAMIDAAFQLEFLCGHLKQFCDLWAKPPKIFLDRYFEFAGDCIGRHEGALAKRLAPFGNLYQALDWALSAPRPLPRALVPMGPDNFCAVDFAFWLGDRILAVLLVGSGTVTRKDEDRRLALREAGIETVEISTNALAADGMAYIEDALPQDFQAFWEDEIMPSSPFKGTSLGEIVRQ